MNRQKPAVTVSTIGTGGHGKTTLAAALAKAVAQQPQASRSKGTTAGGTSAVIAHLEYETEHRRYIHVDYPSHHEYIKGMITGAAAADAVMLVVSPDQTNGIVMSSTDDGISTDIEEQLAMAKHTGATHAVIVANQNDAEAGVTMETETTARAMLERHGFPSQEAPIIAVNAWMALEGNAQAMSTVSQLLDVMDEYLPVPTEHNVLPFFMPIEDTFAHGNHGTLVSGRIAQGQVKANDTVALVTANGEGDATISKIEMFHRHLDQAQAGDAVSVLLQDIQPHEVQRGNVLAAPNTRQAQQRLAAKVYVLDPQDGGLRNPIFDGYQAQFIINTQSVNGTAKLPGSRHMILPGNYGTVRVELETPAIASPGDHFAVREQGQTVAAGVFTATLP